MIPSTLVLFIFVASWMGVAVQSLAMLLTLAWVIRAYFSLDRSQFIEQFSRSRLCQLATFLGLAWLFVGLVSSILNPLTSSIWPAFIPAYMWWAVGPFVLPLLADAVWAMNLPAKQQLWGRFSRLFWVVLVVVCLISATQYWAGWKLQGTEIVDSEKRARALFSHPLSLAYILLLYVPLVTALIIRNGRSRPAWAMVLALVFLIFVSSSRTVQAVVACMGAVFVLFGLRGRRRVVGALVGLGLTGLIIFTDNPVRQRIISTIEQKEDRQQNKYADDRIAFWVVHMDMFKQKPSLGHGLSYRQEYLDRYYEEHGLSDFKKKYPAHNMFLQVLVNTGVAGLLIWLWRIMIDVWACLLLIRGIRPVRDRRQSAGSRAWIGWAGLATIVGVMLAGLTQNAFQDSAVRFHWTILEGLLLWLTSRQEVSDGRGQEAIPA
jgi:O-antigen ligase